jgi:hypothetical protein
MIYETCKGRRYKYKCKVCEDAAELTEAETLQHQEMGHSIIVEFIDKVFK